MSDAGRRLKDAALDRLIRDIPQIDIETEATKLIDRFGTLPAGSGSTQGRSPSVNSH